MTTPSALSKELRDIFLMRSHPSCPRGLRLSNFFQLPCVHSSAWEDLGLTWFLSSLLFGVRSTDPATFVSVSLILGVIACLAACIPARRAIAVNPVIALRFNQEMSLQSKRRTRSRTAGRRF